MDNLVRAIRTSFQRRHLGPFWVSYPAPLQIPDPLKKWPESTGIGGRFEPESVSGLKRNHCPLSTGIYTYNDTAVLVADIVTGVTFFGFPTWRKDAFKLDAVVRDYRGNTLKEYAYEDHVTTWRHMFLLPFIGSAKKAPERVITNMMRYFLRELSTERILQPYFQNKRGDERAEEALVREKPPVAQITTIPRVEKMDVRVIVPQAVIRLHPNPDSPVITPVPMGATLEVKEKTGNWYQVTFLKEGIVVGGYIHENSVEVIKKFGETALEI
jgi:hypothetical protein